LTAKIRTVISNFIITGAGWDISEEFGISLNLAWKSRFHLPVLIAVRFMVLDVRIQLEINVDVQVRHVHDQDGYDEDDDDSDGEVEDDGEGDDGNISSYSLLNVVESEVEEDSTTTTG
jgi:hypothetical protein